MQVKLSLSARDVIKAKIRLVSVAPAPRVLVCVRKNTKVFKKGMLSLDFGGVLICFSGTESRVKKAKTESIDTEARYEASCLLPNCHLRRYARSRVPMQPAV